MKIPLFIGLNGFAGSGKDSVAKMLNVILSNLDYTLEECKNIFNKLYKRIDSPSTENGNIYKNVMTIAFADQLKQICSDIFGIPIERFYYNKANAWVCVNKDFKYTEHLPANIVTAADFYENQELYTNTRDECDYYMSLREILVYIGKYILQGSVNKNTFINIVNNKINAMRNVYKDNLKYIVITDVRFEQELEYMRNKYAVMINIIRPNLEQLNNIAEHDLDDEEDYDFTIINDGSYMDLFDKVYNLIHDNLVFLNNIIELETRDDTYNFLRQKNEDEYELCTPYPLISLSRKNGEIDSIEPVGGPVLTKDDDTIKEIYMNTKNYRFILKT